MGYDNKKKNRKHNQSKLKGKRKTKCFIWLQGGTYYRFDNTTNPNETVKREYRVSLDLGGGGRQLTAREIMKTSQSKWIVKKDNELFC